MIGTKVLNLQKQVINIITTEDGERYVNINDIIQLFPDLNKIKSNNLSEKNLEIGLDYISQYLESYEYLRLYSTTKHHGVKFSKQNIVNKDTLFYILEENQSYLTLALKQTLIQSNIVRFANYIKVKKKSEAEQKKLEASLTEYDVGEVNLHIYYDWELPENDYFIHPYHREDFIEDLYRFLVPLIGDDCVQSWENSNRLLEVSRQKSVKEKFLDGVNQNLFRDSDPRFFLPVLNRECNLKICQKRTELRNSFLKELREENPDYEVMISRELEEQAGKLILNYYHYIMMENQYDIPILAEYESFPDYKMFFAEQEQKGHIFKVYQQKRYRDTLTLRPSIEEHFKHIIDYLFEDAVDKYLESYNTK